MRRTDKGGVQHLPQSECIAKGGVAAPETHITLTARASDNRPPGTTFSTHPPAEIKTDDNARSVRHLRTPGALVLRGVGEGRLQPVGEAPRIRYP